MKLIFITDHMKFSGGRRLMFDYALYLMDKGHDVSVLVEEKKGELRDYVPVEVVPTLSREHIPDCDLIIATSPKEVRQAWETRRGKVVHFCQGFELTDLEQRISGQVLPPRYQGRGLARKLKVFKKKLTWRRKLRRFDQVYKLPTHLISVSAHLQRELEDRYKRPAPLCRNGVDLTTLYSRDDWRPEAFTPERPMRIINIGPMDVTYKGVETTLEAVAAAKAKGIPIEFSRITPIAVRAENKDNIDYALYEGLPRDEFCSVLRRQDVYISNSTEREGFGLPAIEAMASGLIPILSSISAYKNFTSRRDHCLFVPEGDAKATTAAIEKLYNMSQDEFSAMRKNALEVAAEFSHAKACEVFESILNDIHDSGR